MTNKKYVYFFSEGDKSMKDLLGGKGANLAEMTRLGVPVPPGFTITTETCAEFHKTKKWPEGLDKELEKNIEMLEKAMDARFGDKIKPLLVSVRSGAAASMPGMMDTVLNLGINDETVQAIIRKSGNERFAWDSYRRFIQMFGDVDMGVEHKLFEEVLDKAKENKGVKYDTELDASDLKKVVTEYKQVVKKATGKDFPQDPREQLRLSINAIFNSWNNERAITYRKLNNITGLLGTAVNIQTMVFGNMGPTSGTGVCFSRNPSTGENHFYGEFLMNAQGEDVVAGIRTPLPISELKKTMHKQYAELVAIKDKLEKHYKDMQDMEFTIQEEKLYMLQTRNGKRTAHAAVRIAVEMVKEELIDEKTAILRVAPEQLDQLLHKTIDPAAKKKVKAIAKGLPASPGAAVGKIVFHAEHAVEMAEKGEKVVLVRTETSPEDIKGMHSAVGILTARGGMTSHAAVVARGMGKACVAGCSEIKVEEDAKKLTVGSLILKENDYITLDGSTGEVFHGQVGLMNPSLSGDFGTLMEWADKHRKLKVRTNGDTPTDAKVARGFGAEGIGLCRTEHMFFEGDRIKAVREMILSDSLEVRKKALAKLLPMQREDFTGLFTEMKGLPVTIRLLDPPLHEFLPHEEEDKKELAKELKVTLERVNAKCEELHEFNPMLGHRGCRLGIIFPEITEMQARAIFEAAVACEKKGIEVEPEVMVPLVGHVKELRLQKDIIVKVADDVMKESGKKIKYTVGTMIEVPRAALTADEIASEAEFFSFGTNDLTQMGLGLSRDDSGKFLPAYVDLGIYERDPFQALDQSGVGELMKIAIKKGRHVKEKLKCGICGEHGGEPSSVEFCHRIGLNYVSCSPYRIPIARLAAAQAVLRDKE
ncbi:pyruvate, phosphate dikinase [Candidatus Woesearchaeota archaeon]|nr:pyruvate, phosphate dikinase [Candidatus Woesearchaeota archaeon]